MYRRNQTRVQARRVPFICHDLWWQGGWLDVGKLSIELDDAVAIAAFTVGRSDYLLLGPVSYPPVSESSKATYGQTVKLAGVLYLSSQTPPLLQLCTQWLFPFGPFRDFGPPHSGRTGGRQP